MVYLVDTYQVTKIKFADGKFKKIKLKKTSAKCAKLQYQNTGSITGKFIHPNNETRIAFDDSHSSIKALVAFETGSLETIRAIELDCGDDAIPDIHDGEYIETGACQFVALQRPVYLVDFINDQFITNSNTSQSESISDFADRIRNNLTNAAPGKKDPYSGRMIGSSYNPKIQNRCIITQKVKVLLENCPYKGCEHLEPLLQYCN